MSITLQIDCVVAVQLPAANIYQTINMVYAQNGHWQCIDCCYQGTIQYVWRSVYQDILRRAIARRRHDECIAALRPRRVAVQSILWNINLRSPISCLTECRHSVTGNTQQNSYTVLESDPTRSVGRHHLHGAFSAATVVSTILSMLRQRCSIRTALVRQCSEFK